MFDKYSGPQRENIKRKGAKMKKGKREAFEGNKDRLRRKEKRKVDKQKKRSRLGPGNDGEGGLYF